MSTKALKQCIIEYIWRHRWQLGKKIPFFFFFYLATVTENEGLVTSRNFGLKYVLMEQSIFDSKLSARAHNFIHLKVNQFQKFPFRVSKLTKKTNENFVRMTALAFKKKSNQKSSVRESKQNHQLVFLI